MQQALPGQRRGADDVRHEIQRRMSSAGAHIRRVALAREAAADAWRMCREFDAQSRADGPRDLPTVFRNRDLCLAHAVYLAAIAEYLERGGQSRGSFLVMDESERWRLNPPGTFVDSHILEVSVGPDLMPRTAWVDIRPVPAEDVWFENGLESVQRRNGIRLMQE